MKKIFVLSLSALFLWGCSEVKEGASNAATAATEAVEDGIKTTMRIHNHLTAEEKTEGWRLLFDGKSTDGWSNYGKETIGSSWQVVDGVLTLQPTAKADGDWQIADGGDIVTDDAFENFEFKLDWKIDSCGNSGIMHNVLETDEYKYPWNTGPEMQILDDSCHPDAKIVTHRAGDLYDMISISNAKVNPAGEWNSIMIRINDGKAEYHMNGAKAVEFEMFNDAWAEMVAKSKFAKMSSFGKFRKGKISLQDHGDKVSFRNIKVRELPAM